jgi:hypothetical protein
VGSTVKRYVATVLIALSFSGGAALLGSAQAITKPADPSAAQRNVEAQHGLMPQVWTYPKLSSNAVSFRRVRSTVSTLRSAASGAVSQARPAASDSGKVGFPGLYAAPHTVATASNDASTVYASASADFDGKNGIDVVAVQSDGTLNLLLNDGHGTLSLASSNTSAVALAPDIAYVEAADLNGDGLPDIVAADIANSAFLVYLNLGNGTFAKAVSVPVAPASGANFTMGGAIAVGDVDGDGIPDVVAVSGIQTSIATGYSSVLSVQVFHGKGDGTFLVPKASTDSTFGSFVYVQAGQGAVLADLNGDGILDLVTEYVDSANYLVGVTGSLGKGDGTFVPIKPGVTVSGQMYLNSTLQVADLNRDGSMDVAFAIGDGNVWVAQGAGDGSFRAPSAVLQNVPEALIIRLGDFNSDGIPDLLVFSFGSVASFAGHGDGAFSAVPNGQFGGNAPGAEEPLPADFDRDGKLDFVLVDSVYGTASVYRGVGDGSFLAERAVWPPNSSSTSARPNPTESPDNFQVIATGDANGDKLTDVLVYDFTAPYQNVYPDIDLGISDGKGGFTFITSMTGEQFAAITPDGVEPLLIDFNKDGFADLLIQTESGIMIALGQANGVFATPQLITLPARTKSCAFGSLVSGDLNNDGNPDLVLAYVGSSSSCFGRGSQSGYFTMLGDGTGAFTAQYAQYGVSLSLIKLADFDGDGKLDLVADDAYSDSGGIICVSCSSSVSILHGNGDGTFDTSSPHTVLDNWRIANTVPGDYDGDGKQDLALLSAGEPDPSTLEMYPNTQGVLLLKGNGDFTFADPVEIAADTFAADGVFVDLNGDGLPELVFNLNTSYQQIPTYYGLVVMPNHGGGKFGKPINYLAPEGSGAAFVGDFNGDGLPDIMVQNAPSVLFLNQGGATLSLTATPGSLVQGQIAGLQASLSVPAGSVTPTGSIDFLANGTAVGSADLVDGLIAQLTTTELPVGVDKITATYAGDANHLAATAAPITVTVTALAPAFTLKEGTRSLSLVAGQSGTVNLTLAANASFGGSITFACSGLPSGMSCAFTPATLTLAGAATGKVQAVITRSASTQAALRPTGSRWLQALACMAFLPCFLLLHPRQRRKLTQSIRVGLLILSVVSFLTITGCGNGGGSAKTAATDSIVTITATGTSTGSTITQTAVVSVISTN